MNSQIEHKGKVIEISGNKIIVQIIAESACASCHSKNMCSLSEIKEKLIEVPKPLAKTIEVGMDVIVVMRQSLGFFALFLGYLMPFVLLIASLFILTTILKNQVKAGIGAIILLIPYYFILYLFRNKLSRKFEFGLK